ncbi:hypothetical protein A2303_02805 [Candidatus Falkowbacteria bacterium RIFOXYB2_FULL_47_14]|uniref:Uncharacterized protein n=1 Tax=Candidatus Falkowbacteria bacterium RIFOXYA2_FULL_47_19 TaxID=1797994 RepID=A0A1F5SMA1_9BACT|nr:MAG: hypothetical protein A2227_01880 [Candidatus Falkowbacteria bacterium RIFOXYA2_FULL_47_19]OGF36246.1 MAG: hypothetical protein A2468_07550 [Candidatus Falkowbacteria bacterium RIFOXYC2_FULL_46_15]OGF43050.1 MAG: hypothetical protein A2303_02805 [Candidatus Falkowbacteria bacterium RIFOXYB2_FULL_47_14]
MATLRTFTLLGDDPLGPAECAQGRYCVLVEAENEEAVAEYLGGRFSKSLSAIFLPQSLFKPFLPGILKFEKDRFCVYLKSGLFERGVRIQMPEKIRLKA